MSIKQDYKVYYNNATLDTEVMDFVKNWHYSKTARSMQQKHVFKLVDTRDALVGVAIYGNPMSRHYNSDRTIELRRLCLIDNTPKNTESFFISQTLKWLGKNTDYTEVLSFADPNHGHSGIIYKASNFLYDGRENNGNPRIVQYGDKQIHLRQLYQKRDGQYDARAIELQAAVASGKAEVLKQEQKHRYLYNLKDRHE